jgi:hypothetical protein
MVVATDADQMQEQNIDPQEVAEIERIIYEFFLQEYGSERKAQIMLGKLATFVQDPGVRLIHFGNTVFMMILVEPRVAEIHTMSVDEDSSTLAKHFVSLVKFLKEIGVKEAYTYTDDPRFKAVAKRTRLPIETEEMEADDGKMYTIYRVRFE